MLVYEKSLSRRWGGKWGHLSLAARRPVPCPPSSGPRGYSSLECLEGPVLSSRPTIQSKPRAELRTGPKSPWWNCGRRCAHSLLPILDQFTVMRVLCFGIPAGWRALVPDCSVPIPYAGDPLTDGMAACLGWQEQERKQGSPGPAPVPSLIHASFFSLDTPLSKCLMSHAWMA